MFVRHSSTSWRARLRARTRDRGDGEHGSGTVEFVIGAALMVFMLLAIVQIAVYYHLRSVANTAARHGLDRVRVVNGSTGDGISAANQFLDQSGKSLEDRSVDASRTATESSVTVRGNVVAVIPFLDLHVTVEVHAPTERIEP